MIKNKIRFAILIPHWLSQKGGITTYYYNFTEALKKKEFFDISIITPDSYGDEDVINVAGKNKIMLLITTFFALLKFSPEIIHCADHQYMILTSVIYKFFKPGVKLILSFHTDTIRSFSISDSERDTRHRRSFKNIILEWAINKCDFVFSVSGYLTKAIIKELDIRKSIKIIPTGVILKEPEMSQAEEFKKRFNLDGFYPILSTIGGFEWEWKVAGIKLLLESFKLLGCQKGKLIIVGDGKYREFIERVILELSLQDKVVLTGYLDNPFLALAVSDIYCHMALREAVGIAILEAMAMGKPIVAVKKGGIPEIIRDRVNGLLVEPSVIEVVEAIKLLLDNEHLRKKIGENARYIARSQYNWDKFADEYAEFILGIIEHSKN